METRSSASELTSHLGYWLRYVSNHVSLSFARRLESRNVSVAEWVLMRELFDVESMAPSRLAERMGMTRGAITKLADRLLSRSFIRREASQKDGRAQTLALTARGRSIVPRLAAMADENDAEFFGHMTQEERNMIELILKDVVDRQGLTSIPVA